MYQYVLLAKSPLCKALRKVLNMFAVPAESISLSEEHFAVLTGSATHVGLVPVICALRKTATDNKLREFVGVAPNVVPLVNQWLHWALLLLPEECAQTVKDFPAASLAKHVLLQMEKYIDLNGGRGSFLAGTSCPTVADLLLYVAVHSHPFWTPEEYPSTRAWALQVRSSETLAFVISELEEDTDLKFASSTAGDKPAATGGLRTKDSKPTFVKPSEEEILRRRQEKEKAKLAKAATAATEAGGSASTANVGMEQGGRPVSKGKKEKAPVNPNQLDLRVGRFVNVRRHPNSDHLFVEDMDIGTETRTVVSGLVDYYKAEEVEGTLCIAVCNLKPKSLRDIISHGMILCASNDTGLQIVRPPNGAKPGDRILFGEVYNSDAVLEARQLSGNAAADLLAPLRVDGQSVVRWNDTPARHSLGVLTVPGIVDAVVK